MIANRFVAAAAIIVGISALAGTASASTVEASFESHLAFDTDNLVTQDSSLSGMQELNREAESRGRKNEAGEDQRGRRRGRGR
ncbi:MAG: hypothetical protein KIS73_12640 [Enhydrobacter sp.]|nr:hypothetical protein [Enhydrobacter sp.]